MSKAGTTTPVTSRCLYRQSNRSSSDSERASCASRPPPQGGCPQPASARQDRRSCPAFPGPAVGRSSQPTRQQVRRAPVGRHMWAERAAEFGTSSLMSVYVEEALGWFTSVCITFLKAHGLTLLADAFLNADHGELIEIYIFSKKKLRPTPACVVK